MMESHPLADLFPMIDDVDLQQLADDIKTRGQEEPIVIYEGKVLDGRNRLKACELAEVDPLTIDYEGSDPLGFVLSHNLHRRHLTASQRAIVGANIVDWTNGVNQYSEGSANLQTQKSVAKTLSISERAIAAAKRVRDRGVQELSDAIRDGRISVHSGEAISHLACEAQKAALEQEAREIIARAKAIRAEHRRLRFAEVNEKLAKISMGNREIATDQRFPILYLDPATRFVSGFGDRSIENHYPTMTWDEIRALPIQQLATDIALMLCWTTVPHRTNTMATIEYWGFENVSEWVWDKVHQGTGYWGFNQHEILLIAKRGQFPAPLPGTQPRSLYSEIKEEHSAKPAWFAEQIERIWPDLPKVELFARTARPGWSVWGNQSGGVAA